MEQRGGKHNREAVCWRAWSVCVFLLASVWHSGACFTVTSSEHKRRSEPGFWKTSLVKASSWDDVCFEGWNATFAPLTVCFRMVWKNRASGWSLPLRIHYNPSFMGIVWPVGIKPPLTSDTNAVEAYILHSSHDDQNTLSSAAQQSSGLSLHVHPGGY